MPISSLNTIKSWFVAHAYPTAAQFASTWDSFWHKEQSIPISNIENLTTLLNAKADRNYIDAAVLNSVGYKIIQFDVVGNDETPELNEIQYDAIDLVSVLSFMLLSSNGELISNDFADMTITNTQISFTSAKECINAKLIITYSKV